MRKEQLAALFLEHFVLSLVSVKLGKNEMLRHFVRSISKRYQYEFPKTVVLKGSTIGSISSSYRIAPCT